MNHEETIKRIQELVPESIGEDLYRCNRVWEAWQMNTMSEDDFEIIGKPITLAVVLLAIKEYKELQMTFAEAEKEDMGHDWENIMYCFRDMNWNLSEDNFDDQSEKTKTFIGGLLGN